MLVRPLTHSVQVEVENRLAFFNLISVPSVRFVADRSEIHCAFMLLWLFYLKAQHVECSLLPFANHGCYLFPVR